MSARRVEVSDPSERAEALRQLAGLAKLLPPGQARGVAFALDDEEQPIRVYAQEPSVRWWSWRLEGDQAGFLIRLDRTTGALAVDWRGELAWPRAARSEPAEWIG